jgi:hypothetical protein
VIDALGTEQTSNTISVNVGSALAKDTNRPASESLHLSSSVYLLRLTSGSVTQTRKLMLLR